MRHETVHDEFAENSSDLYGALAQLVARYIRIVEVTGSNPVCSTKSRTSEPFKRFGCVFLFRILRALLRQIRTVILRQEGGAFVMPYPPVFRAFRHLCRLGAFGGCALLSNDMGESGKNKQTPIDIHRYAYLRTLIFAHFCSNKA